VENVTLVGPGPVAVGDGPGDYVDDMECAWIINSSGPIAIVFKAFSTEADYDFLKVFDGTSGDVLGSFSGETLPEVLSTNATSLRVVFTSDWASSSAGFALEAFALVPGGTWAPTGAPTALPTWAPDTTAPDSVTFECDGTTSMCADGTLTWSCSEKCTSPSSGCSMALSAVGLRGTLPAALGDVRCAPWITRLHLNDNTALSGDVPSSAGNFGSLKELLIRYTKVRALPESLGRCKLLETLDAGNTELAGLPAAADWPSLKRLFIASTKVKALPEWLVRCKLLETLDASNTELAALPAAADWPNLKTL